jgi:hypothetical protein
LFEAVAVGAFESATMLKDPRQGWPWVNNERPALRRLRNRHLANDLGDDCLLQRPHAAAKFIQGQRAGFWAIVFFI